MLKKAGIAAVISGRDEDITTATKLIFPGMGAFDHCMGKLNESGLRNIIEERVCEQFVPILGICVGLQMFMNSSEEGNSAGLGWVKGKTVSFNKERMAEMQKIPNMGWLETTAKKDSKLLTGLEEARFYFAHSYHVKCGDAKDELISAHYGYDFTAGIEKDNIVGVQFHPEKSHRFGLQLLKNFAANY